MAPKLCFRQKETMGGCKHFRTVGRGISWYVDNGGAAAPLLLFLCFKKTIVRGHNVFFPCSARVGLNSSDPAKEHHAVEHWCCQLTYKLTGCIVHVIVNTLLIGN